MHEIRRRWIAARLDAGKLQSIVTCDYQESTSQYWDGNLVESELLDLK